jgi:hypothetical protein
MNSANFDLCIAASAFNALVFHNSHSENAVFRYVDLKSSFQGKKKGIRNLYFFFLSFLSLYLLLDLLVGLTLEEKQEEKI